jgi:hypothetical protein
MDFSSLTYCIKYNFVLQENTVIYLLTFNNSIIKLKKKVELFRFGGTMAKKADKGQHTKAETITVRVNPKIKYGLELLSRKQHRTLSDVVSWAINQALMDESQGLIDKASGENILDTAWEPYEADRLIKLVCFYPSLLDYEEELIWKFVQEVRLFWRGPNKSMFEIQEKIKKEGWNFVSENIRYHLLRDYWVDIQKAMNDPVEFGHLLPRMEADIEYIEERNGK